MVRYVKLGSNVTFICSTAKPVLWLFMKEYKHPISKLGVNQSTLTILNVNPGNSGFYACYGTYNFCPQNENHTSFSIVKLIISGKYEYILSIVIY